MAFMDWAGDFETWATASPDRWKYDRDIRRTMEILDKPTTYVQDQPWWTDPLQHAWSSGGETELYGWNRDAPVLLRPTAAQSDLLGLLYQWASESAGYDPGGVGAAEEEATPQAGDIDNAGRIYVADSAQLAGGWYEEGYQLEIGGQTFALGNDGVFRLIEPGSAGGQADSVWVNTTGDLPGGHYVVGSHVFSNGIEYTVMPDGSLQKYVPEPPPIPEEVEILSFLEWLAENPELGFIGDITGTDEYKARQALYELIAAGGDIGDADLGLQRAMEIGAGARGIEVGEYVGWLQDEWSKSQEDMQGLGGENLALRERFNRTIVREQEERMMRALSVVRAGGRTTMEWLRTMDQHGQQIQDTQIQAATQIATDEFAAKEQQFIQQQDRLFQAVDNNEITAKEFIDNLNAGRATALVALSEDLNRIIQQNMSYLQLYTADMAALTGEFEIAYMIATLAMDLTGQDMEIARQEWTRFLESAAWDQYLIEAEAAGEAEGLNMIITLIGTILGFAGSLV